MKKKIALFLTGALLSTAILSGCAKRVEKIEKPVSEISTKVKTEEQTFNVVTTIFPEYDWVKQILGDRIDRFNITNLFDKGVDLHSYQPTAEDIVKISSSDLFIYVGGESDGWARDAVSGATNKNIQVVNLVETLGDAIKTEEIVEGMQHTHDHDHEHDEKHEGHDHDHEHEEKHEGHDHDHEHDEKHEGHDHDHEHDEKHEGHDHDHEHDEKHEDHDHDHEHDEKHEGHDHDHDHDHEHDEKHEDHDHDHEHDHGEEHHHHENEKDEHVWLSLKHASTLVKEISEKIIALDPEYAKTYRLNAQNYIEELKKLDLKFTKTIQNSSKKTLLFGDRFPFRYLVDDYGLKYYAAFTGCSAETEASFETVAFLAKKTDELGLSKVLVIENSDPKIANTIISNTKGKDQDIVILNSMQSVAAEEIEKGLTYLSVMENNLSIIESVIK